MKKLVSLFLALILALGLSIPAMAEGTTLSVAAIETAYGSEIWQEVTAAFTELTGIQVDLVTDKNLEDVISAPMKAGDFPDVVHLATGRPAALTETLIKENMLEDIHRRAEHDRARRRQAGKREDRARLHRELPDQPLRRRKNLSGPHVLQPLRPVLQCRPV